MYLPGIVRDKKYSWEKQNKTKTQNTLEPRKKSECSKKKEIIRHKFWFIFY